MRFRQTCHLAARASAALGSGRRDPKLDLNCPGSSSGSFFRSRNGNLQPSQKARPDPMSSSRARWDLNFDGNDFDHEWWYMTIMPF